MSENYYGYPYGNEPSQDQPQTPPQEPPYGQPRQFVPEEPKKKKSGWTAGKVIALALCCSLLGGALGAGAVMLAGGNPAKDPEPTLPQTHVSTMVEGHRENTLINIETIDTSKIMTPAEVYAVNVGSTVGITTSINTNFFGYQTTSAASGSGFILTDDGYILTNHHVIDDSNAITVTLYDGTTYDAALIGYDASNDIAVLKVEAEGLIPVVLGDSDNLNVGESVVAIGNPLGELTFSLTSGTISALDRTVTMSNGVTMNLMQTDCAINSGNSGGALFNLYGEVIGITNAKYSSSSSSEASIDNIGFAIPLNSIRNIVDSIIEKGYISKPYIGVSVLSVSEELQRYGLPKGAAIRQVAEGSPAEQAGLKVDDIITAVNGNTITGQEALVELIGNSTPGDKLKLTVYRMGEILDLELTVGENIQSALEQKQEQTQSQQQQPGNSQGGQFFPWPFG